jgi:hypothetical protein
MTRTSARSVSVTLGFIGCCLGGCPDPVDDTLEDNDSAATATALVLNAETTRAVVIEGDDDFFTATAPDDDGPYLLRFELVPTFQYSNARLDLVDETGAPAGFSLDGVLVDCAEGGAEPLLPRVCSRGNGIIRAEVSVEAGAAALVVVSEPGLCVECFKPEASDDGLRVELAAF